MCYWWIGDYVITKKKIEKSVISSKSQSSKEAVRGLQHHLWYHKVPIPFFKHLESFRSKYNSSSFWLNRMFLITCFQRKVSLNLCSTLKYPPLRTHCYDFDQQNVNWVSKLGRLSWWQLRWPCIKGLESGWASSPEVVLCDRVAVLGSVVGSLGTLKPGSGCARVGWQQQHLPGLARPGSARQSLRPQFGLYTNSGLGELLQLPSCAYKSGAVEINTLILDTHSVCFLLSIILINVKMLSEILTLSLHLSVCPLTAACDVSAVSKLLFKCGLLRTVF